MTGTCGRPSARNPACTPARRLYGATTSSSESPVHWYTGKTTALPRRRRWSNHASCQSNGSVTALLLVSTSANRNSVHEKMNANAAAETIPGAASGHAIFHSDCQREQPSTSAASSSSIGICLKYAYIIQIENGSEKTV